MPALRTITKVKPLAARFWLWLTVSLIALLSLAAGSLAALPYGSGTYGACQYSSCSISIMTGGTVALSATPTSSGVYTIASDSVTVDTLASTGYTLSVKDSDTVTSLENGANTIAASSASPASPGVLAPNTWGWRIDGTAGFGAGPTTAQSSVASNSLTFAGIVASNQTAQTMKTTSSAANPPDVTSVWYGVRVDTAKPAGTYSTQVVYTAVAND